MGVRKRYGQVQAVDGIDLTIDPGGIFGLLGPNGAGKTTTLEMIEGLRKPDAGQIRYGEWDLLHHQKVARERFGVQLQTSAFFELLRVDETIDLFASFYARTLPRDQLIDRFGLQEKRSAYVQNLSGGQRQRLAVAVALVNDPEVVFLDEPTAGLDPQARRNVWDSVRQLRGEGRTVVLTTHYMDEAEALCDRLAVMDHGHILDEGSPQELIQRHRPGAMIELDPSVPIADDLQLPSLQRVQRDALATALMTERLDETLAGLVMWAREHDVPLTGLRTRSATLEDVFLHLTGRSLRD
ncbi:MAG: ABC transporter ATP-binding protein [Thermaerobacter sp.]|nr:ABC transporter ATP-binding protein [Thermaerobacter sp.]